jgi:hypothetical protein
MDQNRQQQRDQRAQQQQQDQNNQQQNARNQQWQRDQNWQRQVQRRNQLDQNQQQDRLSQERQRQRIDEQQQRVAEYRQNEDQRQRSEREHSAELQQQGRNAQYRYQEQYWNRERQQQRRFRDENHDYDNDPYFYTASNYRYNRGGQYYETNQYGANMLREAVNNGYQEGFYAGQADRQDGWRPDYEGSFVYQDANYGYNGFYVSQDDYNYYFREGFQRGYGDGFNRRREYGTYSNGKYTIIGAVLGSILDMESR